MKYHNDLKFNKLRVGSLVKDVPIDHTIFQKQEGHTYTVWLVYELLIFAFRLKT